MLLSQFKGSKAANTSDTMRALFMAKLLASSPLLSVLQFKQEFGNAVVERTTNDKTGDDAGFGFRDINAPTTKTTTSTPKYMDPVPIRIIEHTIKTDVANERRNNGDTASERASQLEDFAVDSARDLTDKIINADGLLSSFKGLKSWIPEARTTNLGEGNGLILAIDTDSAAKKAAYRFRTELTRIVNSIKGGTTAIVMNYMVQSYLFSMLNEHVRTTKAMDAFGNYTEVNSFMGVPIIDAGYKNAADALVIPQTETVGTSTDCSSIYLFHTEERKGFHGITNSGIDVYDWGILQNQYQTHIEGDIALTNNDNLMVARIGGLRFA